jgi:hypothetical protein
MFEFYTELFKFIDEILGLFKGYEIFEFFDHHL